MAPKTSPTLYRPHPDDEEEVRAAFEESLDEGELITLTPEDIEQMARGEWPERLV